MLGGLGIAHPHPCGDFDLDFGSPLAKDLVFAHVGQHPGSEHYHDGSLFGNHGTLINMDPATDWVATPHGPVLDFDNLDDLVQVSDLGGMMDFDGRAPFTFWALLAFAHNNDRCTIIGNSDQPSLANGWAFGLWNTAPGTLRLTRENDVKFGNANFVAGQWYQVGVTYDGSNIRFYVDGLPDGEPQASLDSLVTATNNVRIGNHPAATTQPLNGLLSYIAVWDAARPDVFPLLAADPHRLIRPRRLILPAAAAPPAGNPSYAYAQQSL